MFLSVELTFFRSIAEELQPLLKAFQTPEPMAPFLYDELLRLLKTFGTKFISNQMLEKTDIQQIDIKKESNLLLSKDIDVGSSTRLAIRKCREEGNLLDSQIKKFRGECKEFYEIMVTKLLLRSPIKYPLTKHLRCINPTIAAMTSGVDNLKPLLEMMLDENHLSGNVAERLNPSIASFVQRPE